MSTLEVGKIVPATGTAITLGDSGDTLTVPSGGTLAVASGATINITGATLTGSFGKVLQVLQDLLALQVDTTSTSYVATGLSVAITPASTSSKFLLFLAGGSCHAASGEQMHTTFFVDTGGGAAEVTPSVGANGYEVIRNNGGTGLYQSHSAMCLHSPSTTNSTTYSVYFTVNGGTGNWQTTTSVRTEFSVMELSS